MKSKIEMACRACERVFMRDDWVGTMARWGAAGVVFLIIILN